MEGNCPRCQARQDFPVSGNYQCERCKARFEVAIGSPRPPAPPIVAPSPMFTNPVTQPDSSYGAPNPDLYAAAQSPLGPQPHWAGSPSEATLQAPCAGHPHNPAAQVCERCGDFMCRLCTTVVEGRAYCPKCFDLLYSRGALNFTQKQFTLPGLTLTLGVVALFSSSCFLIGLPIGISGVVTGLRALKEHRTRPDLPKRGMTVAGLSISGISILISLAAAGFMVWAIIKNP